VVVIENKQLPAQENIEGVNTRTSFFESD